MCIEQMQIMNETHGLQQISEFYAFVRRNGQGLCTRPSNTFQTAANSPLQTGECTHQSDTAISGLACGRPQATIPIFLFATSTPPPRTLSVPKPAPLTLRLFSHRRPSSLVRQPPLSPPGRCWPLARNPASGCSTETRSERTRINGSPHPFMDARVFPQPAGP